SSRSPNAIWIPEVSTILEKCPAELGERQVFHPGGERWKPPNTSSSGQPSGYLPCLPSLRSVPPAAPKKFACTVPRTVVTTLPAAVTTLSGRVSGKRGGNTGKRIAYLARDTKSRLRILTARRPLLGLIHRQPR